MWHQELFFCIFYQVANTFINKNMNLLNELLLIIPLELNSNLKLYCEM